MINCSFSTDAAELQEIGLDGFIQLAVRVSRGTWSEQDATVYYNKYVPSPAKTKKNANGGNDKVAGGVEVAGDTGSGGSDGSSL